MQWVFRLDLFSHRIHIDAALPRSELAQLVYLISAPVWTILAHEVFDTSLSLMKQFAGTIRYHFGQRRGHDKVKNRHHAVLKLSVVWVAQSRKL